MENGKIKVSLKSSLMYKRAPDITLVLSKTTRDTLIKISLDKGKKIFGKKISLVILLERVLVLYVDMSG